MMNLKETGTAYPSQHYGANNYKRGARGHPMPSCATISQHLDGRLTESRTNSKLWGRFGSFLQKGK